MNNQSAQTMPECTCRDNEGCTKPCDRKAFQAVPLSEELLIETAILSGDTPQERRLQKVMTQAAAALAQPAGVVVSDEMIERACKDYALRVDGALWPDAYDEHEVLALRAQMREFLLNAIGAAPAASGGETSKFACDDPTCGCKDPAFTEPMEALEFLSGRFKYAGVSHAVARSYARDIDAILAAQPSPPASGVHPDALPDGTLSKSTAKRVEALVAASVSERAQDLLAQAYRDASMGDELADSVARGAYVSVSTEAALRALEQALTQQRGAPVFDRAWVVRDAELRAAAYNLLNLVEGAGCERWQNANGFRLKDTQQWAEFYIATKNVQSFGEVTTPQPSADAVRELVKRWREAASEHDKLHQRQKGYEVDFSHKDRSDTLDACADELESLLSAASGEKGVDE